MTEVCSCPPEVGSESWKLRSTISGLSYPVCEKTGKLVNLVTLKALLIVSPTDICRVEYWFCSTPERPVVSYAQDGGQTILETDLREQMYQKHMADDEVFLCYCVFDTP